MVKKKTRKKIGIGMIVLGSLGIAIPHIGFLTNYVPTTLVPHGVAMLVSLGVLLTGVFLGTK